jgi:hypothetical protein
MIAPDGKELPLVRFDVSVEMYRVLPSEPLKYSRADQRRRLSVARALQYTW